MFFTLTFENFLFALQGCQSRTVQGRFWQYPPQEGVPGARGPGTIFFSREQFVFLYLERAVQV